MLLSGRHEVEVEVRDGGEPERRNAFTLVLTLLGERFLMPSAGGSDGGLLGRIIGQGPLADWLGSDRCAAAPAHRRTCIAPHSLPFSLPT